MLKVYELRRYDIYLIYVSNFGYSSDIKNILQVSFFKDQFENNLNYI